MNPLRDLRWIFLLSLASLPCSLAVSGATVPPLVVFDSFGPGNSYLSSVVWGVTGASTSGGYRGQAEWFVPSASGDLSSITLATYKQSGSGRSNFYLAEDNGSGPGTILESFLSVANNPNGLLTLTSVGEPLLQVGVKYWLCDEPADSTTANGWYQNNQNYAPGFAYERSAWSWTVMNPPSVPPSGVFRISVVPVPEPAELALFLCGGFLLALRTKRRASPRD